MKYNENNKVIVVMKIIIMCSNVKVVMCEWEERNENVYMNNEK